ncbi:MAG: DNA-processing protein DprA [bacterium]
MASPMHVVPLSRQSPRYPSGLIRHLGDDAPQSIDVVGNPEIPNLASLAFFCSAKCPGDLILKTYDLAQALRDAGVPVIGGFHSPMEKECLRLLLRGKQPVIICPARSLEGMRLPSEWRKPLAEARLLLLSPFEPKHRRITAPLAAFRNKFVAALANTVFIAHAATASKTERFCQDILAWGKTVLTLESPENANLIHLGAKPVQPKTPAEHATLSPNILDKPFKPDV